MRVLLINTAERIGGAAIACSRLMEALNNNGIKAKMLVRDKQTDHISVVALPRNWRTRWHFLWERFIIWKANRFKRHCLFDVDIANTGTDITRLPEFQEADIIHLHWVNQGMLSLHGLSKILASGKPVVWTMHDMWPCTAICHHAGSCDRYKQECHHCPYLYGGGGKHDLAWRVFRKKQQLYTGRRITFIACSEWLAQLARQSALTEGHTVLTIPNPLHTALFKPVSQQEARQRCHLPSQGRLLLFGSVKTTDKRKGVDYLVQACHLLAKLHPALCQTLGIVIVGRESAQLASLFPFKVYTQEFVSDERRMADIYNAVDLYVTPSLQENLPNTIMEAMACGTPCVGFHVGGIPEMIDHRLNGYVATYQNVEDLAEGIRWTLTTPDYPTLCEQAVHKAATHYAEGRVAKRYMDVYTQLARRNA